MSIILFICPTTWFCRHCCLSIGAEACVDDSQAHSPTRLQGISHCGASIGHVVAAAPASRSMHATSSHAWRQRPMPEPGLPRDQRPGILGAGIPSLGSRETLHMGLAFLLLSQTVVPAARSTCLLGRVAKRNHQSILRPSMSLASPGSMSTSNAFSTLGLPRNETDRFSCTPMEMMHRRRYHQSQAEMSMFG